MVLTSPRMQCLGDWLETQMTEWYPVITEGIAYYRRTKPSLVLYFNFWLVDSRWIWAYPGWTVISQGFSVTDRRSDPNRAFSLRPTTLTNS